MRFWFEHSSEVSLREQIVAQVTLGILTGELAPGERLPSIRELARRFGLHANTISAGYRQLETEGWVVSRKGSGVYVGKTPPGAPLRAASSQAGIGHLDRLIANLFDTARRLHIPEQEVAARVQAFTHRPSAAAILVVEPDAELRRIVIAELAASVTLPIAGCGFGECAAQLNGALVVCLPTKLARVQAEVPGVQVLCLRIRAIPTAFAEHLPPPGARAGILLGVASRWPEFLRFARTMLVAAGFSPDALIVRDAREPHWRDGLAQAAAVVCDLATANELPGINSIVSHVLAENVPDDLKALLRTHTD
jgi:GntR family transcriptional regulator